MGHADSPLTESGIKHANFLADHLSKVKIDQIYSSDLGRSKKTAEIIAKKLDLKNKLTTTKELREINYGIYANRKKSEIETECPQYKNSFTYIFPEGESFEQVHVRAQKFLNKIKEKYRNQNILVVSHSGVIRSIQCIMNNWNPEDHLRDRIPHEYVGVFEL